MNAKYPYVQLTGLSGQPTYLRSDNRPVVIERAGAARPPYTTVAIVFVGNQFTVAVQEEPTAIVAEFDRIEKLNAEAAK